jgi:hypothetical protein
MIQATIPAAFGLSFTPWVFEEPIVVASKVTIMATTHDGSQSAASHLSFVTNDAP